MLNRLLFIPLLLMTALSVPAQESSISIGTINGKLLTYRPLSSQDAAVQFKDKNNRDPVDSADANTLINIQSLSICPAIREAIKSAAEQEQIDRFNISVSSNEIAAARNDSGTGSDEKTGSAASLRNRSKLLIEALDLVYTQHQDPESVYQHYLVNHISQQTWHTWLELGQTANGRSPLEAMSHANLIPGPPNYLIPPHLQVIHAKLSDAVDAEIAKYDASFSMYVTEMNQGKVRSGPFSYKLTNVSDNARDYVIQKRAAWWFTRYSEIHVDLFDQALSIKCGLGALGH